MNLVKRYRKRGELVWFIDIPAKVAGKRILRQAKGQIRALAEQEAHNVLARILSGKHPFDDDSTAQSITMGEFVSETGKYTLLYRPGLKPSTARRYADLDRQFIIPEFGDVPLNKIDVQAILRAHATLKARGVVPKGPLAYLRRLLRAAVECGELREAPSFPKGLIVQADKLPAAPTDVDVARMLASATPPWLMTAIFLAVYAGLRSGEVRAVRVGDIDLDGGVIHVRVSISENVETTPKSKHSIRDVPIAAPLLPVLRVACAGKLPLARVVTSARGSTPSRTHLLTVFVALQKRLGFAKVWSFHSLRHYFCSTLVRRGVAVSAVQALAGHENIRVTDRYTHATREDLRAGIAVFGKT